MNEPTKTQEDKLRTGMALIEHTRNQAETVIACLESLSDLWELVACPNPAAHDEALNRQEGEPSTPSGRALLDDPDEGYPIDPDNAMTIEWRDHLRQRILAIETEARSASSSAYTEPNEGADDAP